MANYRAGNVLFVDTAADFAGIHQIEAIRYIGNTSGTAVVKQTNTSGPVLWQADGANDLFEDPCIFAKDGIRVEVTNGASVLIYLKA